MFYRDLSFYPNVMISSDEQNPTILCIGWLDDKHPYTQGDVPTAFMERLKFFCCNAVLYTLGRHECPFCSGSSYRVPIQCDEEVMLGSGEIRVFGEDGTVYASPDLVFHYVLEHYYLPPEEFIQAVMECSLPGSAEYQALVGELG